MAGFIRLFKHRLSIASTAPNAILLNNMIYNYRDLYGVQLQSKLSNFQVAINHPLLLGKITHLRLLQLQFEYCLAESPLHFWPIDSLFSTYKYYLPAVLTLAKQHGFSFIVPDRIRNRISGGSAPISNLLSTQQFMKTLPLLKRYSILFKSQLVIPGLDIPFTWNAFCLYHKLTSRRTPKLWSLLFTSQLFRPIFGFTF